MSHSSDQPWHFKFQYGNAQGQPTSLLAKKGQFHGKLLTLGKREIAARQLLDVRRRQKVLFVTLLDSDAQQLETLILVFRSEKLSHELKERLDCARSRVYAADHRRQLEAQGRVDEYRMELCPQCTATIVLTGLEPTPQLFCPFCEVITTTDESVPAAPNENQFRICDDCGLFSQPQKFTILYFWFAIVVYGLSVNEKWCCRTCMRKEAWKMLWGNLIFLLGLPVAIVQLCRAYSDKWVGGVYRGLDTGNACILKGDPGAAIPYYRQILEVLPHAAGVKFNLAKGLVDQEELPAATRILESALQDCRNYLPAASLLHQLYGQQNRPDLQQTLSAHWQFAEDQVQELRVEDAESVGESPNSLSSAFNHGPAT